MIPFSLYVSIEFIKIIQSKLIYWDSALIYNNNHSFATDVQLETNNWYKGKIEYDFGVINLYIDNNWNKRIKTQYSQKNTATLL